MKDRKMTKIVGRIIDGVAMVEPDLIEWKECPHCAEVMKRRSYTCKPCGFTYSKEAYKESQDAFAKREKEMRRENSEADKG